MEKTILYSKRTSITQSLKSYECCDHQHCKQLLHHIKFLSNTLTQKLIKDQIDQANVLKSKQNIAEKTDTRQISKTVEEEIETIRKNYLKLRKQLNQVEAENDDIFEENIQLKKKIEKLEETIANFQQNKLSLELSITNGQQASPIDTKNSFYQLETTMRNSISQTKEKFSPTVQIFPQNIDLTLNNIFNSSQKQPNYIVDSKEESQIFDKYQKLLADFKNTEEELLFSEEKVKDFEKMNKRLQYENQQLKKIIKLRNEIQASRHQAITGLRNVIDELMA